MQPTIKPAHTVSCRDLRPGDEIIIGYRMASIHGGSTEGRVTVVSYGDHKLTVHWPGDQPGVNYTYKTSHLTKLERAQ